MSDKFKKIDDLNKTLENVYVVCENALSDLGDLEGKTHTFIQNKVDDICIRISNEINTKLVYKRNNIIDILHEGYISSQEIVNKYKFLSDIATDGIAGDKVEEVVSNLVTAVKELATLLAGPYTEAVKYVTELTPKLAVTTELISELELLPTKIPPIPNVPDASYINFDKLKITMPHITINDVMTGNKTNGGDDVIIA